VGIDVDSILASLSSESTEERKNAASHCITIEMKDTGEQITLDKAAEINNLMLGYALTVHKSQGSEWRKVYCVFHNSHSTMISQELLYTAVTRAREELFVICEPDTFSKGVMRQRYPGKTWQEKREYFKGRIAVESTDSV
jgi:superfamily I DNA/RNA helicase